MKKIHTYILLGFFIILIAGMWIVTNLKYRVIIKDNKNQTGSRYKFKLKSFTSVTDLGYLQKLKRFLKSTVV